MSECPICNHRFFCDVCGKCLTCWADMGGCDCPIEGLAELERRAFAGVVPADRDELAGRR